MADPTSVLVNGRVDTSKVVTADSAAGIGGRPRMQDNGPAAPADPTQDPDWAQFERVHAESVIPESRGLSEVERFIQSQVPAELRIKGHPAPRAAGPVGAEKPGDIRAPAQAATPSPQQNTQPAADAAPAQGTTVEQRTRAIAALKRDGWKDTAISKLSDADVLEIGLARASSQDEVDSKFEDFRTRLGEKSKAQAPAAQPASNEKVATPASGGPGQTATPTLDAAVKSAAAEMAKTFSDQWGEEVGEPVGAAFEQSLKSLASPLMHENSQLRNGLEALAGMVEGMVEDSVFREWSSDYPQVNEPATRGELEKAYTALIQTGRYDMSVRGIREAWEHARRIAMPGVLPARTQAHRAAEAREYEQSASQQPVVGARAPAAVASSEDGELYAAFNKAHEMSDSAWRALHGGAQ